VLGIGKAVDATCAAGRHNGLRLRQRIGRSDAMAMKLNPPK